MKFSALEKEGNVFFISRVFILVQDVDKANMAFCFINKTHCTPLGVAMSLQYL